MTKRFNHSGISFLYPENWRLEEGEKDNEGPFEISLESPTGPLLTLTFFPSSDNSEQMFRDYLDGFQEHYADLELSPSEEMIAGKPGKGVEAMFYCLDFLVTARIHFYRHTHYLVIVHEQAESREFDKVAPVFEAIKTTLLQ